MAVLELGALLAFVGALGIGVSNVAVKQGLVRMQAEGESSVFAAGFISIFVSCIVFWAVALVRGIPVDALTPGAIAPFVAAGILYPGLFRLLYYTGIDRIGVNITGALVAANPAVASLLAIPVLGERFTLATGAGLVCIVGGGALLQFAQQGSDSDEGATDIIVQELADASPSDLVYPVAALLAVGVGYVLIKLGLNGFPHSVTATALTQTSGIMIFVAMALWSGEARDQLGTATNYRRPLAIFAFGGFAVAIAWLGQFAALQISPVVIVIPLVNTYPLVIAGLSYALAREFPTSPHVIAGILAIVAGASIMQAL